MTSGVFVGRDAELERLDAAVAGAGDRTAVVAVHGPGGVGKSALVARFTELHAGRFAPVWWITANSAGALHAGLAEFALALAPQAAGPTTEQRVESSVRWLASHDGWLLVLDDLADPDDAMRLLGRVRTGTVVITSRVGGWRGMATVAVGALPQDEMVELLCRVVRREWPEADLTGARTLCAELGWQPSAIDQVGAYLAQHHVAPPSYLARLTRFPGWTPTPSSDSVPRLVEDFEASTDHEVRCRVVWELARLGTAAAREALRSLNPRHDIEQLLIREALEL
ncbi:ATP-binding protein [Actinosynnema sp. NPDC051121]